MDAAQHTEQLAIYRRNARHLQQQAAKFGGEDRLPTHLMNDLHDARSAIADLKARLRAAGVVVIDAPEDASPGHPDAPSAQALLDTMPLDVVPEPAPFPPFSRMPYSPNPYFVGRDAALLVLAQALKGGGRVALGPRAAATGLGGIGKTSVASEFVYRYGQFFAGGVFWLSFADPAAVAGEVAACGGAGFLDLRPDFGDLKQDEQVELVKAAWRQETPRLLVFDNCEDPALIEAWAPKTGGCRVLITSRRQRWPGPLQVQIWRLDVLARPSSITLLRQFASRLTDAEANAIATELGDLPLALQLAGSYLAQFGRVSVATYLKEVTSDGIVKHPSLQGKHDEDVSLTAHDRHVGRTVLVSYQRLNPTKATDMLALQLLARAACLAPGEPIPLDLLYAMLELEANSVKGQAALQQLLNLGMVTLEREDTLHLHRLVHAFVHAVGYDPSIVGGVEDVLIDRIRMINQTGYPAAMNPLFGHVLWLTRQNTSQDALRMGALCRHLADHMQAMGDYRAAQPLYERVLAIHQQALGLSHPETATSLVHLAKLVQATSNYRSARPLYEQALAIREQTLGPDHPDTAASVGHLAGLVQATGNYVEARLLFEQALAITEQALGPDHPDTAASSVSARYPVWYSPERNAGESRISIAASRVVGTPSTSSSRRARMARSIAAGRSASQTTSFASSES